EDLHAFALLPGQGATEDGLGPGAGVDVGGVEGRDPEVEGGPDARRGGVPLDLRTVGDPVAVGDLADEHPRAAEMTEVHDHRAYVRTGAVRPPSVSGQRPCVR